MHNIYICLYIRTGRNKFSSVHTQRNFFRIPPEFNFSIFVIVDVEIVKKNWTQFFFLRIANVLWYFNIFYFNSIIFGKKMIRYRKPA